MDKKKSKFRKRVKKAKASGQVKLLLEIDKDSSWQSRAWKLERIWPKEYGKKLEITGIADVFSSKEWLNFVSGLFDALKPHKEAMKDVKEYLSGIVEDK